VRLQAGDTAWSSISDRNQKKNFTAVDGEVILSKLAKIPVQTWNYTWEADTNTPHLGPMAQDFKAAFYPGRDDKSISTLEFDGVELAAIQGLNEKLEVRGQRSEARSQELEEQLAKKETEIAELRKRLARIEQLLEGQTKTE
jgi:flagellar capping protein FliD